MPGAPVILGVLGLLLPLVVVGAIVAVVVRHRSGGGGDGEGSLRRGFLYGLTFIGLIVAASGLAGLLRVALGGGGDAIVVTDSDRGLALGLTLLVVGTPVWFLGWRAAERYADESPADRTTTGRRLYLAAVRVVALAVAAPYAIELGQWALGVPGADVAPAAARTLVWGGVWGYHERVAREVRFGGEATGWPDRLAVYGVAAVTLGVLAVAVGGLVADGLGIVYDALVGVEVVAGDTLATGSLRSTVVTVLVTAVVWWWHWLRVAERDAGSRPWLIYVFLFGILSGTVTVLTSAGILVHSVLVWVLGAADAAAGRHFDIVPGALAGLGVGAVVWGHHQARIGEHDAWTNAERWSSSERIYRYLVAGITVLAAAGGLAGLLAVAVDAAIPGRTLVDVGGGIREGLALGLTMIVVAAPMWWRTWSDIERRVANEPSERNALPRRVLVFAIFGIAVVTAVSAGGALLFELLQAALDGSLSLRVLESQRWSIGLLLSAGTLSAFHWGVLREDRRLAPDEPEEQAPAGPREVVVVAAGAERLAVDLRRAQPGVTVTAWERADPTREAVDGVTAADVARAVADVVAPRALVVVRDDATLEVVELAD